MTTTLFERIMGRLLWAGVGLATALLASGLVLALFTAGVGPLSAWLLNAGLLVLMATPATRVVLACAEFTRTREWFFALASLGVLGVLALTLWMAVSGR
jgi:uncharacterized membrane protein